MARALFKSWFVDFDPVRAKAEGRARQDGERSGQPRKPLDVASDLPWPGAEAGAGAEGDPGLPRHIADLFPDHFKDPELGEIPEGWEVWPLGDLNIPCLWQSLEGRKPETGRYSGIWVEWTSRLARRATSGWPRDHRRPQGKSGDRDVGVDELLCYRHDLLRRTEREVS
jgi:hypothetical protein